MRTLRRQPKDLRAVAIPAELSEFLAEVNRLVEARDELATTESDDLLQCDRAYGGLLQAGGARYGFTYFPEPGIRHKWEFDLSASEIADLALGRSTTLKLWFCRSPECRSGFQDAEESCFYCDYVNEQTG
jgi:hypothetical protein